MKRALIGLGAMLLSLAVQAEEIDYKKVMELTTERYGVAAICSDTSYTLVPKQVVDQIVSIYNSEGLPYSNLVWDCDDFAEDLKVHIKKVFYKAVPSASSNIAVFEAAFSNPSHAIVIVLTTEGIVEYEPQTKRESKRDFSKSKALIIH